MNTEAAFLSTISAALEASPRMSVWKLCERLVTFYRVGGIDLVLDRLREARKLTHDADILKVLDALIEGFSEMAEAEEEKA